MMPDHSDRDLHVVRAAVGIGIDDFGLSCAPKTRTAPSHVGERLQDRLRRRIDDDLA